MWFPLTMFYIFTNDTIHLRANHKLWKEVLCLVFVTKKVPFASSIGYLWNSFIDIMFEAQNQLTIDISATVTPKEIRWLLTCYLIFRFCFWIQFISCDVYPCRRRNKTTQVCVWFLWNTERLLLGIGKKVFFCKQMISRS